MVKQTYILTAVLLTIIAAASAYTVHLYTQGIFQQQRRPMAISVIDWQGVNVTLEAPAEKVISLSSGFTELIYALGCGNKIVGRDSYSDFPPEVLEKPVVAPHDYNPPLEQILEMKPDLLVASTNLVYGTNETRRRLEEAGIAVYVDELSLPERVKTCIKNLGKLLGAEERAEEIISFIEEYENLIQGRLAGLDESEKPKVYLELWAEWNTVARGSVGHALLEYVGAMNIAADQPTPYPIVSAEFVVERNPDIILRMRMASDPDFPTLREQLMSRTELREVKAVKKGNVYIYDPIIMQGVRYPVGLLYWAKWLHPEIFADIDPGAVHAQLVQKFFGLTLEGVYAYP
ncbi:MAG: ABC transporter substrate-binding protein [Candidatus Bathyarchaeia archaeon]